MLGEPTLLTSFEGVVSVVLIGLGVPAVYLLGMFFGRTGCGVIAPVLPPTTDLDTVTLGGACLPSCFFSAVAPAFLDSICLFALMKSCFLVF